MTLVRVLLITGLRLKRGKCGEARPGLRLHYVFGIALLTATACTLLCVGLLALTPQKLDVAGMNYGTMLGFEIAYSAALAAVITPLALLMIFRKSQGKNVCEARPRNRSG